jgi:rsbT co-antagonist protein RsbR
MNTALQEPLLEALREPAAILDENGRVIAANARHTGLLVEQALAGERLGPGCDYLQACALARGGDEQVEALARGVRDVLAGRSPSFTLSYDCDLASPPRSFELVVSAYHAHGSLRALVVHYDITSRRRLEQAARDAGDRLQYVSDLLPDGYWDWNIQTGDCYMSPRWGESLGYTGNDLPHRVESWEKLLHPDDVARTHEALRVHWEERTPIYRIEYRLKAKDGSYRWSLDQGRVVAWDADGKPLRMVGMDMNIHDAKLAELMIKEQAARLMEMSTPLIPISDEVVVMPLIGAIDARRAQQVLSTLLEGLSQRRAGVAILDVTGVSNIDANVAAVLVNASKAVRLLGARLVLTGVRPEVAGIMVGLDIDWGSIVMRGTLQSGIAYATGAAQRGD